MNGRNISKKIMYIAVEVLKSYPVIKLQGKLFYTLLEFHLDQWNARHVALFGLDNHAFLFFSTFRYTTIRDERLS